MSKAPKIKPLEGKSAKSPRSRQFATVLYPESAPANWVEIIQSWHVMCLVSPIHDQDLNPDDTPKKPHYHVLVMFDSMKDYENQVKPMFESIGGVGREFIASTRGYARYLCHSDNPEKHQYDPKDVRAFGGADYNRITELVVDMQPIVADIEQWIMETNCWSYAKLSLFARQSNPTWHKCIMSYHSHFKALMTSLRYEQTEMPVVDLKGNLRASDGSVIKADAYRWNGHAWIDNPGCEASGEIKESESE